MTAQENIDYNRIAVAIDYIRQNFQKQPNLDEVANKINLSPFHFQRLFTEWAGVSPKKFLQYTSVQYAKSMLKQTPATLFDAAMATGLSGTGRLHDLFINIEGMTPGEFKNGGADLNIKYSFANTPFGNVIVASTSKGICYLAFTDNVEEAVLEFKSNFPNAVYIEGTDHFQENALGFFTNDWTNPDAIKLHLKSTEFQLRVWETLLKIPMGQLSTYGSIAGQINNPNASRAVGTAIGSNPVAFLIPCHRVIQAGGSFGNYMWGPTRKTAIIGWEMAKTNLTK